MPPAKQRGCSVILFDVNSGDEFKTRALQGYADICGRHHFLDSPDVSQLILVNTSETDNTGNLKHPTKYKNIVEVTEMELFNPKHKAFIDKAKPGTGNWLEGVLLGVEALEKVSEERGIYTLQMLLFSDLTSPQQLKETTADKMLAHVISKINELNIYVLIVGPEVDTPSLLSSKDDITAWMDQLKFVDNESSTNNMIAKQLVQECNGIICDLDTGVDLFSFYKQSKSSQPWIVPLSFNDLQIPAVTSKLLDKEPSFKPMQDKEGVPHVIFVDAEDESEEVTVETVNAIAMYNKLVMVPPDVDKGIKEGERCFKLIGFTDAVNVPEHYMMASSTNQVVVDTKRNPNAVALDCIIRAAHKLNMYGIALRAYMKNCCPKLYCLIPEVNNDTARFLMVELAYAEDFNVSYQEDEVHAIKQENVDDVLKENIYGFLDSISSDGKMKLHPSLRSNFYSKKIIRQLSAKYLGEEIPNIDVDFGDLLVLPDHVFAAKLKNSWISAEDAGNTTTTMDE